MRIIDHFFQNSFRHCLNCGYIQTDLSGFCKTCEEKFLQMINPDLELKSTLIENNIQVRSLFIWKETYTSSRSIKMKEYIHSLKRREDIRYAFLAELWKRNFILQSGAIFIPAPCTQTIKASEADETELKADHAFNLATALSVQFNQEMRQCLRKVSEDQTIKTSSQKLLKMSERQQIQVVSSEKITGSKRVILVDDVLTTGATALACYRALGKPKDFEVWSLAYRTKLAGLS